MLTNKKSEVEHMKRQILKPNLCIKYEDEINVNMKMNVEATVNTELKEVKREIKSQKT